MAESESYSGIGGTGRDAQADDSNRLAREKLDLYASPLRTAIVSHLSRGPATAVAVAEALGAPYEQVRYHLRRMRKAGFVTVVGKASRGRVRENIYDVDPEMLVLGVAELSQFTPDRLDISHVRILRLMHRESMGAARAGVLSAREDHAMVRFPITLDEQGWAEAVQIHGEVLRDVLEARSKGLKRLESGDSAPVEALFMAFFFQRCDTNPEAGNLARRRRSTQVKEHPAPDAEEQLLVVSADPLRRALMTALALAPASAAELAERLDVPVRQVRYEIERLAEAGLVDVHEKRLRRGATERIYFADCRNGTYQGELRITEDASRRVDIDTQVLGTIFREALEATRAGFFASRLDSVVARLPMALDDQGMADVAKIVEVALDRMFSLREECQRRLEKGEGPAIETTTALLLFEAAPPLSD